MRRRTVLTIVAVLGMLAPVATLQGHAASTRVVRPLAVGASPTYSIIQIPGIPGSPFSSAGLPMAINNKGQVTGTANVAGSRTHAFLFDPVTGTRDLNVSPADNSYGAAINDLGHVVGDTDASFAHVDPRAFIWDPVTGGQPIPNTLGGARARFVGINNSDQVVGEAEPTPTISPNYQGIIWDKALGMRWLKALHCPPWDATSPIMGGIPAGIDNYGEVVGTAPCGIYPTAFHGPFGAASAQQLPGLEKDPYCPAPGGCDRNTEALAINNGLIVGDALATVGYSPTKKAVMWSGGVPIDLGREGFVNGVNRWGQAVGQLANTAYASLYTGQAWIDLNTLLPPNSGWRLDVAQAINDAGQIIGYGNLGGFLMTPGPAALQLVGLEVTQGVQDLNNSVPLIANRDTVVRAYFQTDGAPVGFTARLLGRRNLVALPALAPIKSSIALGPNVDGRRQDFWSSLNFHVPKDWLTGSVELQLGQFSAPIDCKLPPGPLVNTTNCTVTVSFQPGTKPQVKLIRVGFKEINGTIYKPTYDEMVEQIARLRAILPTADIDATDNEMDFEPSAAALAEAPGAGNQFLTELNEKLAEMRVADGCNAACSRRYYGIVKGLDRGGMAATIGGGVGAGTLMYDPWAFSRHRLGHELGHELGIQHSTTASIPSVGRNVGYCNEVSDLGTADFPYVIPADGSKYGLGPAMSGVTAVYGLDLSMVWIEPNRAVAAPSRTFEMMSYCHGLDPSIGEWRWPSKKTYETLIDKYKPPPAPAQRSQAAATTADLLVVRGRVDLSNDTTTFLPFAVLPAAVPPPAPAIGPYTLRLLDGAGTTLSDIPFAPSHLHPEAPSPWTSLADFQITVPYTASLAQVQLLHPIPTVIGARVRDAGAPVVQVTSPTAGATLSGPTATLSWTATITPTRPMTYMVQYSRDSGITWETLVADLSSTSYQVNTSSLGGSSTALIRVMATDGFNATWAQSGTFTVPANPPQVSIVSPVSNQAFEGEQLIRFRASVRDRQDGPLSGAALAWSSDRDGPLGSGDWLEKNANQLSQGTHVITMKATNSAGKSATASVTITIKPSFYFAEGFTGSGFAETFSLLMPNQDGNAIIDYYTASGAHIVRTAAMTAGKVKTVDVNADVGPDQQVSARITLPGAGVAERTMHFKAGTWYGTTDKVGASAPAMEWEFAEGSTLPAFSEFLTLQNPNPSQITATLSYFTDTGLHPVKTLNLPASSRTTVEVFKGSTTDVTNCVANGAGANCGVGSGIGGVSARVTAASPIIAERSFYVNKFSFGAGPISDGHAAFGANAAANVWYFAEGTTLAGFNEYLTLQNPTASPATVDLSYYTDGGTTPTKTLIVPANSRATVEVFNGDLGNNVSCTAGANGNCGVGRGVGGVSVKVSSRDQPIVAERPMYMSLNFGTGVVAGAHVVVGSNSLGRLFGFAWASTVAGDNDYLTIQNPGLTPANLTVTYYLNSGPVSKTFSANAHARATVEIFRGAASNSTCSPSAGTCGVGPNASPIGIVVSSDQPVLVEKLTYSSNSSTYGASATLGYSAPSF